MVSLVGWRRSVVDGGVLLAASDPALGVIRIRTGVALRPATQIVGQIIGAKIGGLTFEHHAPPRRFTTHEGEYAGLFELVARGPGFEMRRAIAVVLGDAEAVVIDGRALRPEAYDIATKVEVVARDFSLGLGSDRWRRAFYRAPAGWHGLARFHADEWVAPDHPKNSGIITVFHTRPVEVGAKVHGQHAQIFEELTAEFAGTSAERRKVELPSGLVGEAVTRGAILDGEMRRATNVALGHDKRQYLLRLDTDAASADANGKAFQELLLTLLPVPSAQKPAEAFNQWSE